MRMKTKCGWTPYRGRTLKGVPLLTMLRGTVIAQDGKVVGQRGFGRYIEGVPQDPVPAKGSRYPALGLRRRAVEQQVVSTL